MNGLQGLIEKLEDPDEAERIYAAEDIGYWNAPDGVPALVERLGKETSRAVHDAIFQALTRIEAEAAIEGCAGLLASEDPEVRNYAVQALRSKGEASVHFLNAVMQEGDKDSRKLVLDVLSGMQTTGADAIYESALSDPDPNVVITAVENLGKIRSPRFRCRIEELLLAGSHPMLTGACLEALGAIGNPLSLDAIRRCFPDLTKLPDFLLASCLKAVGSLGAAAEFTEVSALLPICSPHLRPALLSALMAIHQRHPSQTSDDHLFPVLRAMIENGDPPLWRYQAVRALRYLTLRDDVYSLLVACLSSPERLVRLGAIESLRVLRPQRLENILSERAIQETDEEVRQALSC
jgi:HEAT repeat protein